MLSQATEASDLVVIRAQLAEKAGQLERRCDELQTALSACQAEHSRAQAALHALDGSSERRRSGAVRRSGTFETRELVALVHAMLQPDASMAVADLRAKVEDEARSASRSLVGLRVRLKKALRDEQFVVAENGEKTMVRLRAVGSKFGLTAENSVKLTSG